MMNGRGKQQKKGLQKAGKPVATAQSIHTLSQRVDNLLKKIPKGTFRAGGGVVGAALGGPPGRSVGRALGSGISAITGYGDYTMSSGMTTHASRDVDVPGFTRNANGISVSHREYVGQIALPSTAMFDSTDYVINPGNSKLFPWLSKLALNFQEYKFRGLVFTFQSRTSEYAADNAMGTVMMATNYNVQEKPFSTSTTLLNTQFAVSAKPSTSFIHAVECDPKLGSNHLRYVRDVVAQDTTVVSDPRFYDLGRTSVATEGIPGTPGYVVGVLYISYDVDLMTPVLNPVSAPSIPEYPTSCIVSTPTGGGYDNSIDPAPAAWQRARFNCPIVTFTPTTDFCIVPSVPTLWSNAANPATLADSMEWYLDVSPKMKIKRNGSWYVAIHQGAAVVSGQHALIADLTAVQTSTAFNQFGSASAVLPNGYNGAVPHALGKTGDEYAENYLFYTVNVTGIVDPDTDYVVVTPGFFRSHSSTTNSVNWSTTIMVTWTESVEAVAVPIVIA